MLVLRDRDRKNARWRTNESIVSNVSDGGIIDGDCFPFAERRESWVSWMSCEDSREGQEYFMKGEGREPFVGIGRPSDRHC